ncbi:MAG: hypothetical protein IJ684_02840 [Bacteroidales bacterium]|nr:hypothetical protein [Bacteroidales bacterium]
MKRMELMIEKAFLWLFVVLGVVALVAAVMGAKHQLFVVAICVVMVALQRHVIKEETKRP